MNLPATRAATAKVAERLLRELDQYCRVKFPNPETEIATSYTHMRWMMEQVLAHWERWPVDKLSRWVGFVQGVLAVRGKLAVADERDKTRGLFSLAYEADGVEPPA